MEFTLIHERSTDAAIQTKIAFELTGDCFSRRSLLLFLHLFQVLSAATISIVHCKIQRKEKQFS